MSDVNFIIIPSTGMPHQAFVEAAAAVFPAIADDILDKAWSRLIHLQVACLTRYANECLSKDNLFEFERMLRFIEQVLPKADSDLDNAIFVSFLEDLKLDGDAPATQAARQLLSEEHLHFYTEVQKWHRTAADWLTQHGGRL